MSTEILQLSRSGARPEEVFELVADQARELGFEYCVYGLRLPVPVTKPRTVFYSNYDPAWQQRYQEQGYLQVDPTVAHGMRSSEPALWSKEFFAQTPQLWAEAQSYGLRYGWLQSRRDAQGSFSLLVLSRSREEITSKELIEKAQQLQWLVEVSHVSMKQSCSLPELDTFKVQLTDREIDVLRWTADGKTSAEIAEIMGISERTVNFHVNTAVAKLGARNKTSAAVRATTLGLIW